MGKLISRKEAIKKTGVTALAITSLVFLKTKSSSATSGGGPPYGSINGNGVAGGNGVATGLDGGGAPGQS